MASLTVSDKQHQKKAMRRSSKKGASGLSSSSSEPLFAGVWQSPYVDVFKQLHVFGYTRVKEGVEVRASYEVKGDVEQVLDRAIGKKVFRVRGSVPAANYLQVPRKDQTLGLTGQYLYVHLRVAKAKFFTIHVDVRTTRPHSTGLRLSFSNLYKKVKVNSHQLSFPAQYFQPQTWTVFALDLASLVRGYTDDEFVDVKAMQFSSSLKVRTVYSSDTTYSTSNLPVDMRLPVPKESTFRDVYDWFWVYHDDAPDAFAGSRSEKKPQQADENAKENNEPADPFSTTSKGGRRQKKTPKQRRAEEEEEVIVKASPYERKEKRAPPMYPSTSVESIPASARQAFRSHGRTYAWTAAAEDEAARRATHISQRGVMELSNVVGFLCSPTHNVAWSFDGQSAIFGSANAIVMQHLDTGVQRVFTGHTAPVATLEMSPNGRVLASAQAGREAVVRLWDVMEDDPTRQCHVQLCAHHRDVVSLSFSPDSRYLAAVGQDRSARVLIVVWDLADVRSPTVVARQVSEWHISKLRFVPNPDPSHQLVSCGRENIRFWRIKNGHMPAVSVTLNEYGRRTFTDLAFESPVGVDDNTEKRIFVATEDGSLFQVNQQERQLESIYHLHENAINCVAVTDAFCVTGSSDGFLRVWALDFSDYYLQAQHAEGVVVSAITVSPDGLRVLSGCDNGSIGVLDLATTDYASKVRSHAGAVNGLAVDPSPERDEFTTVSRDGTIRVWNTHDFRQIYEFQSPNETVTCVCYDPNPDQYRVVCGFESGYVRVCDIATTSIPVSYKQHTAPVQGVLFANTGNLLFSRAENGSVCVYDSQSNYQPIRMISTALTTTLPLKHKPSTNVHVDETWAWAVSPNGKYLAVTSRANATLEADSIQEGLPPSAVIVYECPSLRELFNHEITDECDGIAELTFSADSLELLMLLGNGRGRRYSMFDGCVVAHVAPEPRIAATCATVSPQGRFAVAGNAGSTICVWDYYDTTGATDTQVFAFGNSHVVDVAFARARSSNRFQYRKKKKKTADDDDAEAEDEEDEEEEEEDDDDDSADTLYLLSVVGASVVAWKFTGNDSRPLDFERAAVLERQAEQQRKKEDAIAAADPDAQAAAAAAVEQSMPALPDEKQHDDDDDGGDDGPKGTGDGGSIQQLGFCPKRPARVPITNLEGVMLPTGHGLIQATSSAGYNGGVSRNLVWCESRGLIAYTCGNIVALEALDTSRALLSQRVRSLHGHIDEVQVLARSRDGRFIASGASASSALEDPVRVWDVVSGECVAVLSIPPESYELRGVHCLAFVDDDKHIAAVSNGVRPNEDEDDNDEDADGALMCVWNWAAHTLIGLAQLPSSVSGLTNIDERNGTFVTVGAHVIRWTLDEAQPDDKLASHVIFEANQGSMLTAAASCGQFMFGGTEAGIVLVWHREVLVTSFRASTAAIMTVQATDNARVVVCDEQGRVGLWAYKINKANLRKTIFSPVASTELDAGVAAAHFENEGNVGVVGTGACSLWFVDLDPKPYAHVGEEQMTTTKKKKVKQTTREPATTFRIVSGHSHNVSSICFDESGHFMATGAADGSVRIWRADSAPPVVHFQVKEEACLGVVLNATATRCVCAFSDGIVRFLDVDNMSLAGKCELSHRPLTTVAFANHSSTVLCGSANGLIYEVDGETFSALYCLEDHKGAIINDIQVKPHDPNNDDDDTFHWLAADSMARLSVWKTAVSPEDRSSQHSIVAMVDINGRPSTSMEQGTSMAAFSPVELGTIVCSTAAGAGSSGGFRLAFYSYITGQWVREMRLSHVPRSLGVSATLVAVGNTDGTVTVMPYATARKGDVAHFPIHADAVHCVQFSPSGSYLASGSFAQLQLSAAASLLD